MSGDQRNSTDLYYLLREILRNSFYAVLPDVSACLKIGFLMVQQSDPVIVSNCLFKRTSIPTNTLRVFHVEMLFQRGIHGKCL